MSVFNLLEELVKIDSSTQEGANKAVDFCAGWLTGQGISVKNLETQGAQMLVAEVGSGDRTLVLNGHVDVVPGKPNQFSPYIKEGKMFGRGTADMKAGAAAMMWAVKELKQKDPGCRVMLQIVSDEETGSHCARYLADEGYLGDFVICGEPTQLDIGLQSKGVLYLDLLVKGRPAHGSRPWEGENAILKAFSVYQDILQLPFASESSDMYPFPSIDLPIIEGGTVYNQVPDTCRLTLDIRYLPEQTEAEILKQIESITDSEIRVTGSGNPVTTKRSDPYIKLLEKACSDVRGAEPRIFGQHGSSDGKHFAKFGIPAVEFGPSGADWHGNEEFVTLESVEQYVDIITNLASGMWSQKNKITGEIPPTS